MLIELRVCLVPTCAGWPRSPSSHQKVIVMVVKCDDRDMCMEEGTPVGRCSWFANTTTILGASPVHVKDSRASVSTFLIGTQWTADQRGGPGTCGRGINAR